MDVLEFKTKNEQEVDKAIADFLKEEDEQEKILQEKKKEEEDVKKRLITNAAVDSLLQIPTEGNINAIIEASIAADDFKAVRRDISRIERTMGVGAYTGNTAWDILFNSVIEKADIESVIDHFLGPQDRSTIKCPFHEDRSPSMQINPDSGNKGTFFCHGCGAKGGPIDFAMKFLNISFRKTVEYLSLL